MGNESKIDYTLMNRFGVNQVQSVASTLTQMEDFIEQQKLSPGYDKDIVQLLNIFSVYENGRLGKFIANHEEVNSDQLKTLVQNRGIINVINNQLEKDGVEKNIWEVVKNFLEEKQNAGLIELDKLENEFGEGFVHTLQALEKFVISTPSYHSDSRYNKNLKWVLNLFDSSENGMLDKFIKSHEEFDGEELRNLVENKDALEEGQTYFNGFNQIDADEWSEHVGLNRINISALKDYISEVAQKDLRADVKEHTKETIGDSGSTEKHQASA